MHSNDQNIEDALGHQEEHLSQWSRDFAAALLDELASWQQESGEIWSTQRLQDAIDSLRMDYDGLYVDMATTAQASANAKSKAEQSQRPQNKS